jgi:hypothetical protein
MNPEGVGFDKVARDLSISNALIIKAAPSILIPNANASRENPKNY